MNTSKKFLAAALTGALFAGIIAGCGSESSSSETSSGSVVSGAAVSDSAVSSSASESADSEGNYNICMIVKHTDEHFKRVMAGAQAYADENNLSLDIQSPTSATDYDAQINMLETAIGSGAYDAIIIAPLQSESVAMQVDNAKDMVFVALDTDFDSVNKSTFVGTGNEDAAKSGGKAAAEEAIKRGAESPTAVILTGVQGDETHEARLKGYTEGIEEAGGTVVDVQYCDSQADKAATAMEGVMEKYPDGVDIVLSTDDNMAVAAAKARSDAGLDSFDDTVMVGFDGNQGSVERIGKDMDIDVAQKGYDMGYKSMEAAVDAINGKQLDAFIDSGSQIVTADNVDDYIANMKEIGVWDEAN